MKDIINALIKDGSSRKSYKIYLKTSIKPEKVDEVDYSQQKWSNCVHYSTLTITSIYSKFEVQAVPEVELVISQEVAETKTDCTETPSAEGCAVQDANVTEAANSTNSTNSNSTDSNSTNSTAVEETEKSTQSNETAS